MTDSRFRVIDVHWKDSCGACWARAEIMRRYAGEDFYLQLDSHHRFCADWDVKAIDELTRTQSDKPILTAYAPPFDPDRPDDREQVPMQMNFDQFTTEGVVLFRPGELHDWQARNRPMRARFLSAHFLFTVGAFVEDVPYDPELYFIGEEITMAVRAFTSGYDLYHPTQVIVWHEYTREYRTHKHWSDHERANGVALAWHERDRASLDKVRRFLTLPRIGQFGLGSVRTFAEYEAFAGLSVRYRRVQDYTRRGLEPPNPDAAADWAQQIRSYHLEIVIDKSRLPADVDDYQFWYVGVHDGDGSELFRADADELEVTSVLDDDSPDMRVVRTFESDRVPATWTVWPVSHSRGWLPRLDGVVVSTQPGCLTGSLPAA